ncbi:MAG: hypothetical protein ACREQL_12035, partial [Candidatus Binatia bacterium]
MKGSRVRPGTEFDYDTSRMKKDAAGNPVLPSWVVPANSGERNKILRASEAARNKELAAVIAAAGPKRDGKPGARVVNTGLADATAEPPPAKAVTSPWVSPTEKAVAASMGVVPADVPAAGSDLV